jgi:hypothetical protein
MVKTADWKGPVPKWTLKCAIYMDTSCKRSIYTINISHPLCSHWKKWEYSPKELHPQIFNHKISCFFCVLRFTCLVKTLLVYPECTRYIKQNNTRWLVSCLSMMQHIYTWKFVAISTDIAWWFHVQKRKAFLCRGIILEEECRRLSIRFATRAVSALISHYCV